MKRTTTSSPLGALVAVLAAFALLGAAPAAAFPSTAAASLASSASTTDPCPKTVQVDGRTAYLGGYICGTVTLGVGVPIGPVSVGFTVGHCTSCECGYVWDMEVGMQFTRTSAAECGWGSGGGSGSRLPTSSDGSDDGGCQWGRDYIGWEPAGC